MTFKLLKGDLREQAYHPDKVGDDIIYLRKPRSESVMNDSMVIFTSNC